MNRKFLFVLCVGLLMQIIGCAERIVFSTPTFTTIHERTALPTTPVTITPTHTRTLTPTVASTQTLPSRPTPTPDFCDATEWQDEIRVLSEILFTAVEPGGPVEFDRILTSQNPDWADFHQEVYGEMRSAGIIFHETAFGPELGTGVNPAVILVTYGVERDWELPPDGNLRQAVEQIRAVLYQHDLEWSLGKVDRSQYPPLANAATYALYRYFNGDTQKLDEWCHTYVQVFGESPLKTSDK